MYEDPELDAWLASIVKPTGASTPSDLRDEGTLEALAPVDSICWSARPEPTAPKEVLSPEAPLVAHRQATNRATSHRTRPRAPRGGRRVVLTELEKELERLLLEARRLEREQQELHAVDHVLQTRVDRTEEFMRLLNLFDSGATALAQHFAAAYGSNGTSVIQCDTQDTEASDCPSSSEHAFPSLSGERSAGLSLGSWSSTDIPWLLGPREVRCRQVLGMDRTMLRTFSFERVRGAFSNIVEKAFVSVLAPRNQRGGWVDLCNEQRRFVNLAGGLIAEQATMLGRLATEGWLDGVAVPASTQLQYQGIAKVHETEPITTEQVRKCHVLLSAFTSELQSVREERARLLSSIPLEGSVPSPATASLQRSAEALRLMKQVDGAVAREQALWFWFFSEFSHTLTASQWLLSYVYIWPHYTPLELFCEILLQFADQHGLSDKPAQQ